MKSKKPLVALILLLGHVLLSFSSDIYAGIVGGIPASFVQAIYESFGGKHKGGEFYAAAVASWIPATLIVEGVLLLLLTVFLYNKNASNSP